MSPKPRSSVPSTWSSATRDSTWSTTSGRPRWLAGKKGVRRLQRDLSPLPVRRQVPLLPAAARADGAWRGAGAARLLLLWPVPAELPSLRRGPGAGGRDQPRADAAGLPGGDLGAVWRRGRGCAAALCPRARVAVHGAARHGRGRDPLTGPTERGAHGRADAAGVAVARAAD